MSNGENLADLCNQAQEATDVLHTKAIDISC
jgi:hypothetical protein